MHRQDVKIRWGGKKGFTRNAKKTQALLGIVPNESNLYEELSGWENLVFCEDALRYGEKAA